MITKEDEMREAREANIREMNQMSVDQGKVANTGSFGGMKVPLEMHSVRPRFSLYRVAEDYRQTSERADKLRQALDVLAKRTSETDNEEFIIALRNLRECGYDV